MGVSAGGRRGLCVALAVLVAISGCSAHDGAPGTRSPAAGIRLPPVGAGFDYQLGGAYDPPARVSVVERDSSDRPARLGYDICYVNGFQTQPSESQEFVRDHPDLLLRIRGEFIADPNWPDEYLLDSSTEAKRAKIARLIEPTIRECSARGYAAVEIDNLDSFTRSHGAMTLDDNVALASVYVRIAHRLGLAIAQKNTAEQSQRLAAAGYDFAVAESCVAYDECEEYARTYPVVLDVEYSDEIDVSGFDAACRRTSERVTVVLRDHDLMTPSTPGYVYRACDAAASAVRSHTTETARRPAARASSSASGARSPRTARSVSRVMPPTRKAAVTAGSSTSSVRRSASRSSMRALSATLSRVAAAPL
ncbi:endo alpha-1,4 polygalactosaminidase [Leifsonia shinshuensis]|uniref:endo alpha-1,4 polygalactosaminidase n=1 Tax=Leifsonia shinshuensis TaxID=150026 RepID=UPI001F50D5B1|nr:endo alpha-1,4 polygalactosaminidase [Leifsonia shinshuensis]MCI0158031.1 endo alpha-1,4 polygalactosaminidase [Leifsonia shinshuensis]